MVPVLLFFVIRVQTDQFVVLRLEPVLLGERFNRLVLLLLVTVPLRAWRVRSIFRRFVTRPLI